MQRVIDLRPSEAKAHFLKGSSYFNGDFPSYISFEPILSNVADVLKGGSFAGCKKENPANFSGVNYSFVANKDGRFAWRPYELMHPAIYVSIVNLMCEEENWKAIGKRFQHFKMGVVECCSDPVVSDDHNSDTAAQVSSWWQRVEQRSIASSLDYTHVLNTDVTDCYGSLYTHSISWALHGKGAAKSDKIEKKLLGTKIDSYIQASRSGQTNGIAQGSVLMDFIAELVLGYVDCQLSEALAGIREFTILRYRDDYRVFTRNDQLAEHILKTISDELRSIGMKLGVAKTTIGVNVIEGSVKPDKLAGIEFQDLGLANAATIQKQLLRLHGFGRRFPNSGALRRLVSELHTKTSKQTATPDDLDVQVAIATDIAVCSPLTFPAIAGILSHLISLAPRDQKTKLWTRVHEKMKRVPYNGYLEVWLQRVTKPKSVAIEFESAEPLCQIVDGNSSTLWENDWIASKDLLKALDVSKIVVGDPAECNEKVLPSEVELFTQNALLY